MPGVAETICSYCSGESFTFTLKLIPSGKSLPIPRWLVQIKQICTSCGRFKKFAVQSDQLINAFNKKLKKIEVSKKPIEIKQTELIKV